MPAGSDQGFGLAEVGAGVVGLAREDFDIMIRGLGMPLGHCQNAREAEVRLSKVWPHAHSPRIGLYRFCIEALFLQDGAE